MCVLLVWVFVCYGSMCACVYGSVCFVCMGPCVCVCVCVCFVCVHACVHQRGDLTFGSFNSRVNSVVLMLTDRGLMLNLQQHKIKPKRGQRTVRRSSLMSRTRAGGGSPSGQKVQGVQWRGVLGEGGDLDAHHRGGGVLQCEQLHLYNTETL